MLPDVIRYPVRCTNMPQRERRMTTDTKVRGFDKSGSCQSGINAGTMEAGIVEPAPTLSAVEPAAPPTVHVLAIDDDPSVRQMIADYLGDNDIRVTAIASGRGIADVMARHTIDLIVLDLKLPGEDGMTIARALRAESN